MAKQLGAFFLIVGLSIIPLAVHAATEPEPAAAVTLTRLRKGTLPRVITIYGTVDPTVAARRLVMAPLSASVAAVYVHEGEAVARGIPLVRLVPSPASKASYEEAKSAVRVNAELVRRTRSMVAAHLATDQQLFQAEKAQVDAEVTLSALRARGAAGPTTIRAHRNAIVAKIMTAPGAIVSEGNLLLELAQPSGLVLKAGAIPTEATAIHRGDPVVLTSLGGGEPVRGTVLFRGAAVNSVDGLVPVDISVPSGKALLGEMFRADITIANIRGYIVPHQAILVNNLGDSYIVQAVHMVARTIPVRVLSEYHGYDVVSGKLLASDPVVVAGNYQLNDGMRIRLDTPRARKAP